MFDVAKNLHLLHKVSLSDSHIFDPLHHYSHRVLKVCLIGCAIRTLSENFCRSSQQVFQVEGKVPSFEKHNLVVILAQKQGEEEQRFPKKRCFLRMLNLEIFAKTREWFPLDYCKLG